MGNSTHETIRRQGRPQSRWSGMRPTVRGTVMNPVDHPDGGGEGKTTAGSHPVTPWGEPTLGYPHPRSTQGVYKVHHPRRTRQER